MLKQLVQEGSEAALIDLFAQAPGPIALLDGSDNEFEMANPAFVDLVGQRDLVGRSVGDALPEFAKQGFVEMLDQVVASGRTQAGRGMPLRRDTDEIFVDFLFHPMKDRDGEPAGILIQAHDVTEYKKSETIRAAHGTVLRLALADSPLEETLSALIGIVESTSRTGVLGSILLLDDDGKHLRHGAAPSLPRAYSAAIHGAEIGSCAGSCGTAAYTGMPVFVSDIATDPLWAAYKDIALPHGLRACWSTPIMVGRKVLGTFAMYHREPREPTVRDLTLVDLVTQTAALVIERQRDRAELGKLAPA